MKQKTRLEKTSIARKWDNVQEHSIKNRPPQLLRSGVRAKHCNLIMFDL